MLQHGIQNQAISNMKESHLGISCFIISKVIQEKFFKGKFSAIRTCRRNTHVKSSNLRKRWNWEIHRHIHLAAAFATMGKKVIQIGCDPKADSTMNLLGGEPLRPVMNYMREEDEEPEKLEDIAKCIMRRERSILFHQL